MSLLLLLSDDSDIVAFIAPAFIFPAPTPSQQRRRRRRRRRPEPVVPETSVRPETPLSDLVAASVDHATRRQRDDEEEEDLLVLLLALWRRP